MKPTTYKDLGALAEVIAKPSRDAQAHEPNHVWTGKISLTKRTADNQSLADRIAKVLQPATLDAYYAESDVLARTRCIDGRIIEGYEHDAALRSQPLGPQVPGGTPLAALAWRIVHSADMRSVTSLDQDILDVVGIFTSRGIGFGGHIDDADHPNGDTGCGAIDLIPQVLQHTAKPSVQQELRGLTKMLLGDAYQENTVDLLLGRIIGLQATASRYFSVDEKTGMYNYKRTAIDLLRKSSRQGDPVARQVGPHHEVAIIINTVTGTTFNRDEFAAQHNGALQLFNYDVWYSQHGATLLYPTAPTMPLAQATQHLQWQYEYITCRVLLAVATLMVLTDGSVHLIVRSVDK